MRAFGNLSLLQAFSSFIFLGKTFNILLKAVLRTEVRILKNFHIDLRTFTRSSETIQTLTEQNQLLSK